MQNVKQKSVFTLLSTLFLALPTTLLLISCSKNTAEMPVQVNPQPIELNESSASTNTGNSLVAVPFERKLFVPCLNGGAGEEVVLTGTMNFVYQMFWTDRAFRLVYHDNSSHVTGIGLTSGEQYVASGGTQGTAMGSWIDSQWIGNTTQQLRVIGQNSSFFVNYKYHLIVTSDGNVSVSVKDETSECR